MKFLFALLIACASFSNVSTTNSQFEARCTLIHAEPKDGLLFEWDTNQEGLWHVSMYVYRETVEVIYTGTGLPTILIGGHWEQIGGIITTRRIQHEFVCWPQPHQNSYTVKIVCLDANYEVYGNRTMTVTHATPVAGDSSFDPRL